MRPPEGGPEPFGEWPSRPRPDARPDSRFLSPGETGTETGEEAMSENKKPEPFKRKTIRLTGWVLVKKKADQPQPSGMIIVKPKPLPSVKPRQKKPDTDDIKRRINEELEFLMEMEDRIPRKKDEKEPVDYEMEQMIELCVDGAMADLRRALSPEELEIYEKCYRFYKRTSSKIIRDYTAEQILRRAANLRGEK
jgi:hypothetical protein